MSQLVVDASALARAVLDPNAHDLVAELSEAEVHAPHLIDAETLSVLRRQILAGAISRAAAIEALPLLGMLVTTRHDHRSLQERALELAHNLSAYDALYVALAEKLDTPLLTLDARLASAPGSRCAIRLVR